MLKQIKNSLNLDYNYFNGRKIVYTVDKKKYHETETEEKTLHAVDHP